jgi:hypothetical protein
MRADDVMQLLASRPYEEVRDEEGGEIDIRLVHGGWKPATYFQVIGSERECEKCGGHEERVFDLQDRIRKVEVILKSALEIMMDRPKCVTKLMEDPREANEFDGWCGDIACELRDARRQLS